PEFRTRRNCTRRFKNAPTHHRLGTTTISSSLTTTYEHGSHDKSQQSQVTDAAGDGLPVYP
ncbi:MAG: hypothetical protein QGG73_13160, partial [Candidatus Hydrogenedentes bacterium]|nr:hypothetical protein [Candidatus Hydrogenedentota bacterium]